MVLTRRPGSPPRLQRRRELMKTNGISKMLLHLAAGLLAVAAFPAAGRADDPTIKIGAVLPVTGKESKIGGAYKQATEFAVKEVNDAGGLDVGGQKRRIDLRLLDDTS